MRWAANLQRRGFFDVINAGGNVQLLRHHIVGGYGVGIGGRAQQLACIRLDVPVFIGADDGGPVRGVHALRGGEGEGAAALRNNVYGGGTRHGGQHIGPCASGVDEGFGLNAAALWQGDVPEVVAAGDALHFRVAPQLAAALAQAANVALVQAVHVNVACAVVQKTVYQHFGVQHGHQRLELLGVQASGTGGVDGGFGVGGIDQ